MPPVLGPVSPSPMRLWSWLVAMGKTLLAVDHDDKARLFAVEELFNDHAATRIAEGLLPESMSVTAASACSRVSATMTPLPAARPSAFTTIGAPCSRR